MTKLVRIEFGRNGRRKAACETRGQRRYGSGIEFRGMDIETEIQFQGMDIQERGKKTKKNYQKFAGIGKF